MDINIKIAIISLILVATLALATVCFLRIKFYRRVNKIALYIFEEIKDKDKILDMCTGTAANAIRIAQKNPYVKVVGIDLSKDEISNFT